MLLNLNISNYAIIDSVNIHFDEGLNIITGETGAGKSIIIGALNIVLGGRWSKDSIRTGCDKASVEAMFNIEKQSGVMNDIQEYGIDVEEDNTLLITREVYASGRSIARVNGRIVTLSMLKSITNKLVDIHSQNDQQSLTNRDKHIDFIDMLGDDGFKYTLQEMRHEFKRYFSIKSEYSEIKIDDIEKERKKELLNYQISEIDDAELIEGEDDELAQEFKKLSNMEMIAKNINFALNELDSDGFEGSIIGCINNVLANLNSSAEYDEELCKSRDMIQSALYDLQEAQSQLRGYVSNNDFDNIRYQEISDRLDKINTLKRKYGRTIDEIFEYRTQVQKNLDEIINLDERLESLSIEMDKMKESMSKLSETLHAQRIEIANSLRESINCELKDINMAKADFQVGFEKTKHFNEKGNDDVEFLIATNLGQDHKPLSKIASGGEMSRISLSFKSILAELDDIDCLVFDEIDMGISGRTAHMVGKKISKIASVRQIICITHLPQIACLGQVHFRIDKIEKSNKTFTVVNKLSSEDRVGEIARLIGGESLTETTRKSAIELLNQNF